MQISAHISEETRNQLECYADAHGIKKGALIEQALLHHLQALQELPADVVIPPRLVLEGDSFAKVSELVVKPRKAARASRKLMSGGSGDEPGL